MRVPSFVVICCILLLCPLLGCGEDTTPKAPERTQLENFVAENPDVAANIDQEEEVESDTTVYDDE